MSPLNKPGNLGVNAGTEESVSAYRQARFTGTVTDGITTKTIDQVVTIAEGDTVWLTGDGIVFVDPSEDRIATECNPMNSPLEKAARAVASQLGDYDSMLVNKREWIAMRGTNHAGDPVDVNGPFRDDCIDIARAVLLAVRELDEAAIQAGERAAWDDDNAMPAIRAMPKGFAAIIDHLVSTGEPS